MKLTVRLGKPGRTTKRLLKKEHGLTGPIRDWDDIKGSELYFGQSYDSAPIWKKFLEGGMDTTLDLNNQGAAAVLFVPTTNQRQLIYIFGYGFLSIQTGFTEWDFGLKIVLNTIPVNGLKSVDSHSLDYKSKNRRVQLGTHGGVGEFDIDIMQDLVSHISGLSTDKDFAKSLSGGESLSINVDMEGTSLVKKSNEIMARYGQKTYKTVFSWIDFINPEKDESLIVQLDEIIKNNIDSHLAGTPGEDIILSFPAVIDMGQLDHFKFQGYRSKAGATGDAFFEKSGFTLEITYNPANQKVIDFFIAKEHSVKNFEELELAGNVYHTSSFLLSPVRERKNPSMFTGVTITPK